MTPRNNTLPSHVATAPPIPHGGLSGPIFAACTAPVGGSASAKLIAGRETRMSGSFWSIRIQEYERLMLGSTRLVCYILEAGRKCCAIESRTAVINQSISASEPVGIG